MVFYLGYYDLNAREGRVSSPAGNAKMGYVADVISSVEKCVIVSAATISTVGSQKASLIQASPTLKLKKFHAVSNKNRLIRGIWVRLSKVRIASYLIANIHRNDILVVYHSLALMPIVRLVKKVKKMKLILDCNEIYNDVVQTAPGARDAEVRYCQEADAYLLACKQLNSIVNPTGKPFLEINGATNPLPDEYRKRDDGFIHVVYAGTLAVEKGGAAAAADVAAYLPSNYWVHILGFGSKEQVDTICAKVEDVSRKAKARVSYEGVLYDDEFNEYIGRCHVGLSTQNPDAKFSLSSFPSKILTYMSAGLRVVTIRIPVIEESSVGSYLFFYDEQSPEVLASAIMKAAESDCIDPRKVIKDLDVQIRKGMRSLLFDAV